MEGTVDTQGGAFITEARTNDAQRAGADEAASEVEDNTQVDVNEAKPGKREIVDMILVWEDTMS